MMDGQSEKVWWWYRTWRVTGEKQKYKVGGKKMKKKNDG